MKFLSGYFLLPCWSLHFSRFSNTERQKNKFQPENKTFCSLEIGFLRVLCFGWHFIKRAFFTWEIFLFVNTNQIQALKCEKRKAFQLGHLISSALQTVFSWPAVYSQQRYSKDCLVQPEERLKITIWKNFPQIDGTTSTLFCDSVYTDASYAFHDLRCWFH